MYVQALCVSQLCLNCCLQAVPVPQDWELMVAQLEHQLRAGKLTLQALWYYVQPPLSALKLVASLAAEASAGRLRGAGLLDLLHARCGAAMGDAAAHRLALRLLRAAAEPYFAMLQRWLAEGAVDDPYAEFMVQESAVSAQPFWGAWGVQPGPWGHGAM